MVLQDWNPFAISVPETMSRFVEQNDAWCAAGMECIEPPMMDRLIEGVFSSSAPDWPLGKDAFRSLKIRFGEQREGMIRTFEAHVSAIERVHSPKFYRSPWLLSGEHPFQDCQVDRLRLFAGNDTHRPTVQWVITDLSACRNRPSVTAVRGPNSLADEGLVIAWLFPERLQAIDYDKWPGWFCAGYESNVPEFDDGSWQDVVFVDRGLRDDTARLCVDLRCGADLFCSVPSAASKR